MPLRINGDTSGYVQLNAPAVAGTTNLTLPLNGFGKVLQVVHTSTSSLNATVSSTTFVDTGLSATITPSSTSSKVLIIVNQWVFIITNTGSAGFNLLRDSTIISGFARSVGFGLPANSYGLSVSTNYLDSPNTTNAVTYKTQFNRDNGTASIQVNQNSPVHSMTLIEVGP